MIETYFDDPRHRVSEERAFEAEQTEKKADTAGARRLYADAARLEEENARAIPTNERRVRSILGISAVSLWLRADEWDEAARAACSFLASPDGLTPDGARDLRVLVDRAWRTKEIAGVVGKDGTFVPIEARLAGGLVRVGLAPSVVVSERRDVLVPLLLRVGEWCYGRKYRKAGPSGLAANILFYEAPALAASFGLRLFIGAKQQQPLKGIAVSPRTIAERFLDLVSAAGQGPAMLEEVVQDEMYRQSFLRSLRDLAPDGGQVGEVTFSSALSGRSLGEARLVPEQRAALTKALVATGPDAPVEAVGILKAISLRGNKPSIVLEDGSRFRLPRGQHDDSIGPKLNRRVRVIGTARYEDDQAVSWAHDILMTDPIPEGTVD